MTGIHVFDQHVPDYENWFETFRHVYKAELRAVRSLMPETAGPALEVGVGTGRFAEPLGIAVGLEPSPRMGKHARRRGIHVVSGMGEALPFRDAVFESVLMVTTICFLDSIKKAFTEAARVLAEPGFLTIGLIDRKSPVGRLYREKQKDSLFYRDATFYAVDVVVEILRQAGFTAFTFRQTIFKPLHQIDGTEPVKPGYGNGSFVVIRCAPGKNKP